MTDGNIPTRTGVVGGGQMGAGIVHGLLLAGSSVVLLERDEAAATAARERVQRSCDKSVERGKIADAAEPMGRLTTTTEAADPADCGPVVEAVPEDEQLKRDTLQRVEAVIGDDAALATNTSSISLDALATSLRRPERLLGLHFFNPVPASKLVEIVIATATDETWRERAVEWVSEGPGKTPVVVADSPGFASSRLGVAIGPEAIRMLEAGVASAEDIDAAMSLGYGHPMGPLRLTDLVGLDVRPGIARYLERELGPRFAPPQLLVDLVEQGHHGRKTGRGFYDWNDAKEKTA
ncbi:3-hydroxyacyl-CoA dehydrogenase family protein [Janibacter limosus]|uniref:3-hydroxyacyl-CoA dehydrogenase family protein n=1 Tax=Janibacter limosus TaxID=53458 RepID=A0AC61U6A7_9MICO|nr:3-hydroxyacyl-CoA dehydrogenase family protein [Janibacter limosus]UUZ45514.1 3-hydroxyacyl-CoA dehydrogenase family protein [Janibacter limosus]